MVFIVFYDLWWLFFLCWLNCWPSLFKPCFKTPFFMKHYQRGVKGTTKRYNMIYSFCRYHNPVISSFMTSHRVYPKCNSTGATCWAGTAYPSGAPPVFIGVRVVKSLVFCVVLYTSLFVIFSIVLSFLLFTDSGFPLWYIQTFHRLIYN